MSYNENRKNEIDDLVSVIMPSYNTASYILSAIRSVQAQTHENWELIIVDDCSTDDTVIVVTEFLEGEDADPRIKLIKNTENQGAALSRNRALREAHGRWIAFLDSDDLWHPNKLERQLDFMKSHGCAFSYTYYDEIDGQGEPLGVRVKGPKRIGRRMMYRFCWMGCLTAMYDAEVIGLLQIKDIKKNNDYAMWLLACEKADCYLLPEVLASYRRGRTGSVSTESIPTMIGWHYRLFHEALGLGKVRAVICTFRNLVFGAWKKIRYVEKEK